MCSSIYRRKKLLGEVNAQDPWMEMVAMGPDISDAEIQDNLYPIMNHFID